LYKKPSQVEMIVVINYIFRTKPCYSMVIDIHYVTTAFLANGLFCYWWTHVSLEITKQLGSSGYSTSYKVPSQKEWFI